MLTKGSPSTRAWRIRPGLNTTITRTRIALRYQLDDHVDFDGKNNRYHESSTQPAKHSPILAWARDGLPIYGPYGYSDPKNPKSAVRRMVSGYVIRDGKNGTKNLALTGRTSLPKWAERTYNMSGPLRTSEYGPNVECLGRVGRYIEDNDYLGDLGKMQGRDFDLDECNGRFCVTPEFPKGTWAYFVAINGNGNPAFPYNNGQSVVGAPSGGPVRSINEAVTTSFAVGKARTSAAQSDSMVGESVSSCVECVKQQLRGQAEIALTKVGVA